MRDLRRAMALLELEPRRVFLAVVAGVATLGSALLLAGLSAWLIVRAWEMPPVLDLTVAVVAVRALGDARDGATWHDRGSIESVPPAGRG